MTETDLVEGYFYMWLINFLNTYSISSGIELIAVELHQNKRKWLFYVFINFQIKMIRSLWKQLVQLLTITQPNINTL